MANFFDQFDSETSQEPANNGGNFFDQFDEKPTSVAQSSDPDGSLAAGFSQLAATQKTGLDRSAEQGAMGLGNARCRYW